MTTFRWATRAVAGLLMAEGLVAVSFGVWAAVEAALLADVASLLEVNSAAWAAVAAAEAIVFAVLPGLGLVEVARRWFVDAPGFAAPRRVALYLVLVAHVVLAVLGALTPSAIAVAVGVVGVAAVAVLVAAAARVAGPDQRDGVVTRSPRTRLGSGRVVLGAVLLVLLASGAAAAVAAQRPQTDVFAGVYPRDAVVCDNDVNGACAERAAASSEQTVAWVRSAPSRTTGPLVVARRPQTPMPLRPGSVFEDARDGWVRYTLYTNPAPPLGPRRSAGEVTAGSITAAGFIDEDSGPSVDLEWSVAGTAYRLTAWRLQGDAASLLPAAKRVLVDVQYQQPPAP